MKARLGTAKAITAAAHKLTRIVQHLVTTRQEFNGLRISGALSTANIFLRAQAREIGFELVKLNAEAAC